MAHLSKIANKERCNKPFAPCNGKVIYRTFAQAKGEARWMKMRGLWGGAEHPYRCKYCNAWHLTSDYNKVTTGEKGVKDRYS